MFGVVIVDGIIRQYGTFRGLVDKHGALKVKASLLKLLLQQWTVELNVFVLGVGRPFIVPGIELALVVVHRGDFGGNHAAVAGLKDPLVARSVVMSHYAGI